MPKLLTVDERRNFIEFLDHCLLHHLSSNQETVTVHVDMPTSCLRKIMDTLNAAPIGLPADTGDLLVTGPGERSVRSAVAIAPELGLSIASHDEVFAKLDGLRALVTRTEGSLLSMSADLGAAIREAITEGDGLFDAIDIQLDAIDPDDFAAFLNRVREKLGLVPGEKAADGEEGLFDVEMTAETASIIKEAGLTPEGIAQEVRESLAKSMGVPVDRIQILGIDAAPPSKASALKASNLSFADFLRQFGVGGIPH